MSMTEDFLIERDEVVGIPDDVFRPSDYTALLIEAILSARDRVEGARALEVGCGSGVVLAALAEAGAASVCGIDIEFAAVAASTRSLAEAGYLDIAEVRQGDMWAPVAGRQFDLIVANLPHFPSARPAWAGRLSSWSGSGAAGRAMLDRFLHGAASHLAPSGRALFTHSGFVDLERSRDILARGGLAMRVATTRLLCLPAEKLRDMTGSVLRASLGHAIRFYGRYAFAEVHVIEVRHRDMDV
jgi:release factor glutamine methyltransferase